MRELRVCDLSLAFHKIYQVSFKLVGKRFLALICHPDHADEADEGCRCYGAYGGDEHHPKHPVSDGYSLFFHEILRKK